MSRFASEVRIYEIGKAIELLQRERGLLRDYHSAWDRLLRMESDLGIGGQNGSALLNQRLSYVSAKVRELLDAKKPTGWVLGDEKNETV